jgi:hypothetical protein
MNPKPRGQPINQWYWRRVVIFATIAFCMTMITWVTQNNVDNELQRLALTACFYLLGCTVFIYVLGAGADDVLNLVGMLKGLGRKGEDDDAADRPRRRRSDLDRESFHQGPP